MPRDLRPHLLQAEGEIGDLRLARRIHQFAIALGKAGGHEKILGGADGGLREDDPRTGQAVGGTGHDIAFGELDLRAQLAQALQMQIDGPRADGAAAGQRHLRLAMAGHQRPQHQDRSAHLAHQIVWRTGLRDPARRQFQYPALVAAIGRLAVQMNFDTKLGQQIGHGGDVGHMGQIAQGQRLFAQKRGSHQRQRCVLGATYRDLALQAVAAAYANSVHETPDARRALPQGRSTICWVLLDGCQRLKPGRILSAAMGR